MARRHFRPPAVKPHTRYNPRPTFTLEIIGDGKTVFCSGVASEWFLFRVLHRASKERRELLWFESQGHPLTSRGLSALNAYLRAGAMRFFRSKRLYDGLYEMFGPGEWHRFCRMLNLTFDGKDTGPEKKRPTRHHGFSVRRFAERGEWHEDREAQRRKILWAIQRAQS